jgi:pimeloyl-ACP methyl ester carboxylesterase
MDTNFVSTSPQQVSIAGHRLECLSIGPRSSTAPTLVFLHEGLGSVSLWRDFPEALCHQTGCGGLAYSRWGHGNSAGLDRPRSVRFMHDEALIVLPQLLDAFEILRPILIGHSDGGSIALIYSGSRPGSPAGLILEAPHVFVEDLTVSSIAQLRDRYATTDLRARLGRHHANVDSLFRDWTNIWLSPEFRAWNIEEFLPAVRARTLLIQGLDDEYGTSRQVDTIASAISAPSETLMLGACGHAPHMDQRAAVETAMARFISRCTSPRGTSS